MSKLTLHPFSYCLIPLIAIIGIFISNSILQYLLILIISSMPVLSTTKEFKYKYLGLFSLSLIPPLFGYLLASYYFSENSLLQNITLVLRLFCLSIISFTYIIHLHSEQLILEFMKRRIISSKVGFALIATNNAFIALHKEFNKIQISYQMRFGKKFISPSIVIPLLLYSRGIMAQRTFYTSKISWYIFDSICTIFMTATIILVARLSHSL